jgi:hypothetical protein
VRQSKLLRRRSIGIVRPEIHVTRAIPVGSPHPLECEGIGVQNDDTTVAVAVGHIDLVGDGIHDEIGRAAHVRRVCAPLAHPCLAKLPEELSLSGEGQKLMILAAVAGQPHDVLVIDEHTVLGLRPFVARTWTSPRVDECACLIELEYRRGRNTAVRLGRFVVRA